ncbi:MULTISPECIES: universal stress protein [unclassified Mucilaginibacter]|uniref:universal stress protein n=1 Tax=unclassified Mucilaginibacter TaxID=2617802 RepID=UPI002AC98CD3|nr:MULTISPECIES: universal stress protein [unclassified Mucilaginibacter]MEB0262821.1 universal stress protein [Mucilaginibacter sp. 10I4]MEB0277660.1 universal stress protein [Mucilaginibacter sp. 10B2]MEB0299575.1 universal stress protein [Mucilaginibacter sp. 5C4]WPX24712.1 universal stress protein [Mucilaginibacter sp. 5C4]
MNTQIKRILLPIDLSETSLNALNTAMRMAKRHNAQLHLLYTQDIMDYYPKMGRMAPLEPMLEEVLEKDKLLLEKIVQSIFYTHQINCFLHVEIGYRSTIITEKSKELDIDVIVLGTAPDIADQSYLNDSLAYKILQNTTSHVLTVPAGKEINNFKKIIFPVLIQENAITKLKMSRSLIEKNNATVSVVGIVKQQDLPLLSTVRDFSESIKRRAKTFSGSVTRKSVYSLNSSKDIMGISKNEKAQLIVVEGNTKRNFKEFFFGNFTQRMIRNAEFAVLFIKDIPLQKIVRVPLQMAYSTPSKLNL